jgi:hypothetical protein
MKKSVVSLCLAVSVLLCVRTEAAPGGLNEAASTQLCPGNKATCEAESTCCGTVSGDASACCPLKNAVCCADGAHCCPAGTTCNVDRSTCDTVPGSNMTARPAVRKQQTTTPAPQSSELFVGAGVTCPDRVSQCPVAGAACCRVASSSRFTCCNYPLNVCCDDGLHCCHVGTVCDQTRLQCIPFPSAVQSLPWTELTASSSVSLDAAAAAAVDAVASAGSEQKADYVVCPDGGLCPDLNTCCMLTTGRYGCCPYYLATCCRDRVHCCPNGKHCTDTGLCVGSGEDKLPWAALARNP